MSSKFFGNRTDKHQPKKNFFKPMLSKTSVIRITNQSLQVSEKLAGEANILNLVLKSEKAQKRANHSNRSNLFI